MVMGILASISDAVGIVGVILLLIAFYFLNTNKMSPLSMSYQLLNFFGAWFILYSLFFNWNTASALIEAAWIIISMIGIYNAFRNNRRKNP